MVITDAGVYSIRWGLGLAAGISGLIAWLDYLQSKLGAMGLVALHRPDDQYVGVGSLDIQDPQKTCAGIIIQQGIGNKGIQVPISIQISQINSLTVPQS